MGIKCSRCKNKKLVFEKIKVDGNMGILSKCCGSDFNELITDWDLKITEGEIIDIDAGDTYYNSEGEIGF